MENAKHTPGPWVNNDGIIRDCSPEGWLVATCRFNPKDDANARLIAAAPELLEALEYLESRADCMMPLFKYEHEKIRAAIAKAKGE